MKYFLRALLFVLLLLPLNSQTVEAHREESACQLANACQSLLSERIGNVTYWTEGKERELRTFIEEWQLRMDQQYVEYDTIEIYSGNLFENISVDGKPVSIIHNNHQYRFSDNRQQYKTYTIYAIYKSEDPHLYLFGYEHDYYYPVVLYTDLETYTQGMIEFWPTQNEELAAKFLDILIFGAWD